MKTEYTELTACTQPIRARDEWVLLAPRGDHPHERGIQRVDEESLRRIVGSFHSLWGRVKRALVGRKVYCGHPDAPDLAGRYPDHTVYGLINDLEQRAGGLFARLTLTEEGAKLVNGGVRWLSPYWKAEEIGRADSRKVYRPVELVSVGLTRHPNIRGESLANSRKTPGQPSWPRMKTEPLTANLRERYTASLRVLRGREEITALVNEKRASGQSYDDAFQMFFQ